MFAKFTQFMQNESPQQRNGIFYVGFIPIGLVIGGLLGLSVSPVVSIAITALTSAAAALVAGVNSFSKSTSGIVGSDGQPIQSRVQLDPWPLACIAIGIMLGAWGGIAFRNSNFLGSNLSIELDKWEAENFSRQEIALRLLELQYPYAPLSQNAPWMTSSEITATVVLSSELKMWESVGLNGNEVARRLFEIKYPLSRAPVTATIRSSDGITIQRYGPTGGTVLYVITSEECDTLYRAVREGATQGPEELRKIIDQTRFDSLLTVTEDTEVLQKVFANLVDIICD